MNNDINLNFEAVYVAQALLKGLKRQIDQGEKVGLILTLAKRLLSQLGDDCIIQLISGNVSALISFETNHQDAAQFLEIQYFPMINKSNFSGLPNW